MTMKTKKTLQHIAAVAVVLLTLCLVFAAPAAATEGETEASVDSVCTGCTSNDAAHSHVASMQNTTDTYYYTTLWDAANATQVGEQSTITLLNDAKGSGVVVDTGKKITFDFGNHKYEVVNPTVGSTGTETQGFQLLKNSDITIKNGYINSSVAKFLIQNYANLTLENIELDGTQLADEESGKYVLSNNYGQIHIKSGAKINAADDGVAFDVYNYSPYYVPGPTVTVYDGATIIGKIEVSSGNDCKLIVNGGTFTDPNALKFLGAEADVTVTLTEDVDLDKEIEIANGKKVTLNLNGKTLTGNDDGTDKPDEFAFWVTDEDLVLVIDGTVANSKIYNGRISLGADAKTATLTINGGTYETTSTFVMSTNGGSEEGKSNIVTATDATFKSTSAPAIYLPGPGEYTFTNCIIEGTTGLYVKSGTVTLEGTTSVKGTAEYEDPDLNNNGASGTGDAIVLDTNTNYGGAMKLYVKDSVVITSANGYAIHENVTESDNDEDSTLLVDIRGGTITGKLGALEFSDLFNPENAIIMGGTFSSNPSAYIESGYEVVQPGDKYLVQKYVDRSSSSSSSSTTEPEEPEQPEEPVVEPETPAAPGEVASSTEVTDGGEVAFETTVVDEETGEQSAPAAADSEIKGVVLPTGTEGTVEFVPVSEQAAPAGEEENTKRVFEINVPNYEKGKAAVIKFQMTVAELAADGKEAADVALWHFDEETGEWTKLVTSYTIVDGVVYFEAITEDFSPFAIIYEDEPVDEPVEEPETPESPAPVLGLLAALGAAVVLRRK